MESLVHIHATIQDAKNAPTAICGATSWVLIFEREDRPATCPRCREKAGR